MIITRIYTFLCILISGTVMAHANSLLKPAKFPTTYSDLSFTERMENEQEGYEPYAGLSAYHQMALQSQEDAVEEAVAAELRAAGINDDHFMTPVEEVQSTQCEFTVELSLQFLIVFTHIPFSSIVDLFHKLF